MPVMSGRRMEGVRRYRSMLCAMSRRIHATAAFCLKLELLPPPRIRELNFRCPDRLRSLLAWA